MASFGVEFNLNKKEAINLAHDLLGAVAECKCPEGEETRDVVIVKYNWLQTPSIRHAIVSPM